MLLSASIDLSIDPEFVERQFWDIKSWTAIWAPMEKVTVLYEDVLHQEVIMQVDRGGERETNRTIRLRQPEKLTIDFFSPVPPPMMSIHNGKWIFRKTSKGSQIMAAREFALRRLPDENDMGFIQRSENFAGEFKLRLTKILERFKQVVESRSAEYV